MKNIEIKRPKVRGRRMMEQQQLEMYRRLLLKKRGEVLMTEKEQADRVPAARRIGGDLGDQAVADREAKVQLRLRESNRNLLRAIANALERIAGGNYGLCEACQRPIPANRLKVVPWTRFCRDCKDQPVP